MVRAARQNWREAERRFPVRVRVALPANGLGRQLELMHAWLDDTCGAGGWGSATAGFAGIVNDAIAFYFADPVFAQAFVARFCCGWRIDTIDGAFAVRENAPSARRDAPAHKTP